MKGYKVTDSKRSRTVGLASKDLEELLKKGKEKLRIKGKCLVALEDGTLVQDPEYFTTLPAQTVFVFYKPDEHIVTGVDVILNALRNVNSTYLNVSTQAAAVMQSKANELTNLLNNLGTENGTIKNQSDSLWFDGLETNATTKEDYMFRKAQDRIRGYFYKFQDDVRKCDQYKNETFRKNLTAILESFRSKLNVDRYFGCYFDRRCAAAMDYVDSGPKTKKRMKSNNNVGLLEVERSYCDADGLFVCEGLWRDPRCLYDLQHLINPYASREARVVFSTWNLDHRIEKSRTILPALLSAVSTLKADQVINVDYFYRLLFTKDNLKLVHIVCHDKTSHDALCDPKSMFLTK